MASLNMSLDRLDGFVVFNAGIFQHPANPFPKILDIVVDEASRDHKTGDDEPAVSG